MSPSERAFDGLADVEVAVDDAARAAASSDFGGIARGLAYLVLRPGSEGALAAIVDVARRHGIQLTPRCLGLSQSGQSLPHGGASVQLGRFAGVAVDRERSVARCGASATWRALVEAAAPFGLAPCVTPFNLDLSVGGVLSAGGLGSTSHLYGFAVSTVESVRVVTGGGAVVVADRSKDRAVYDAVLGGVGAFGFITEATVRLRSMLPWTRTYYLLYDDLGVMLEDERAVMTRGGCLHLEGFASAAVQGVRRVGPGPRVAFARWFYGMHVSVEYQGEPPSDGVVLEGLRFSERVHTEDSASVEFAARYDVRFSAMRAMGTWEAVHPWFEATVPSDTASQALQTVVPRLPLLLGDGHRMMPVADVPRPELFVVAEPGPATGLAVLPAGVAAPLVTVATEALRSIHDYLLGCGGKRYLSGWLFEPGEAFWRTHYGPKHSAWCAARATLDPDSILGSVLLPRGSRTAGPTATK